MEVAGIDPQQLAGEHITREHLALMRHYGEAQARCSRVIEGQAAEIKRLHAQSIRLRAAVITRDHDA